MSAPILLQERKPILASAEPKDRMTFAQGDTERPTASEKAYWGRGACIAWNEIARELAARKLNQAPDFSRVCALVSVAQYDAACQAGRYDEQIAISAASATILSKLFPEDKTKIDNWHCRLIAARGGVWTDAGVMEYLGQTIGNRIAEQATLQLEHSKDKVEPPKGPGVWTGHIMISPNWGKVKPWFVKDIEAICPKEPPTFGSPEFKAACEEVREVSEKRTVPEVRAAMRWGDGAGTNTPSGHWNHFAILELERDQKSEVEKAAVLAALNIAMMDAGIACWACKYKYWLLRPVQADPRIKPLMATPFFPSYVSGHASFSSAAADILSAVWPKRKQHFQDLAKEATLSRVTAGIHYRFDCDEGNKLGVEVARQCLVFCRERGLIT